VGLIDIATVSSFEDFWTRRVREVDAGYEPEELHVKGEGTERYV